jgi:glucokinase
MFSNCDGYWARASRILREQARIELKPGSRMSKLRLIGDIGGTNARFAVSEHGSYSELSHVAVSEYASLQDALVDYVAKLPRDKRPVEGALAVAGPVSGDHVQLTNVSWSFSTKALESALGLSSLTIVNDFAATAMAIPFIPATDLHRAGDPQPTARGPIGIIGPGTGLGVSSLVPHGTSWTLLPGEGGHVTLPAVTTKEDRVLEIFRKRWEHVSAERALSGAGLVNLYEAICAIGGRQPEKLSPADVTDRATRGTDPACVETFETFCSMLGTVAGNLALTVGATGGIYIAGGILLRFKEAFASSAFRGRFENKGRFRGYLQRIPTFLILEESPALLGLSNLPLES